MVDFAYGVLLVDFKWYEECGLYNFHSAANTIFFLVNDVDKWFSWENLLQVVGLG